MARRLQLLGGQGLHRRAGAVGLAADDQDEAPPQRSPPVYVASVQSAYHHIIPRPGQRLQGKGESGVWQ